MPRAPVPVALYRQWWTGVLLSASVVLLGTAGLYVTWQPGHALQWGFQASLTLAYVIGYLRRLLACNRRLDSSKVLPLLGIGNVLSLARGVLAALLAGFLFAPLPPGLLAWMPAVLFLAIGMGDFMDGYLARIYDDVTLLGARLDLSYDALAILVATALAVQYGQLPLPYLILGLEHYLFHGHMALRRRRGRPVHPLPPSSHRRFFAGGLMGFLAVALAPVFAPPITVLAGGLIGLPVVAGFVRDWLVAVGHLDPASDRYRRGRAHLHTALFHALPVAIRGAAGAGGIALLVRGLGGPVSWLACFAAWNVPFPFLPVVGLVGLTILALGSVGIGWRGRLGALGLLAVGSADLLLRSFDFLNASVVASSISVLLLGTGAFSYHRPEEDALLRHAGSPRSSS